MSKVIIENHGIKGRHQQAEDPCSVFGGAVVDKSGEYVFPYGLGMWANGSNAYATLPGILFAKKYRLGSAKDVIAYGTSGSAGAAFDTMAIDTRTKGLCCAKTVSSSVCTGIIHDIKLNVAYSSSYDYALSQHAGDGTDAVTVRLNNSYTAFPAIRQGFKVYFFVPCAWGYPFPDGTFFPEGALYLAKKASSYLQFVWRADGNTTNHDVIRMDDPGRFRATCEPFGFNCEYTLTERYSEADPYKAVAGLVRPNNLTNAVSIKFA